MAGIGGTDVTSGEITGFRSIYVNGVEVEIKCSITGGVLFAD